MRAIPGNLADAAVSCGTAGCHPDQVARVATSMMATARGIVAVDRWVFGERDTPDPDAYEAPAGRAPDPHEVPGSMSTLGDSPADSHLRALCASCHLGTPKTTTGPLQPLSRGGGCLACHLVHDEGATHARLTVDVPSARCFGCHARSGRISTNYSGWHETVLGYEGLDPRDSTFTILADGRVFERMPPDVHHEAGMECIDCHTSREVMGDGIVYGHQEEAIETTCTGCHSSARPATLAWDELGEEDRRIVALRSGKAEAARRFVASDRSGRALINVFLDEEGRRVLEGKLDGRRRLPTAPADACARPGHERLSCQSCHSAWNPQCLGCHTQRTGNGEWVELLSDFRSDPPVLGVRETPPAQQDPAPPQASRIEPFAPGMIMTLNPAPSHGDPSSAVGTGSFHRLFAPSVPHTTAAVGRTCESCHLDPLALGVGRGTITLGPDLRWWFNPEYAALRDGLPADAWTPFLRDATRPNATRTDARPFTPAEQEAILRVGACLSCHPGNDPRWRSLYDDFDAALRATSAACRVPVGRP